MNTKRICELVISLKGELLEKLSPYQLNSWSAIHTYLNNKNFHSIGNGVYISNQPIEVNEFTKIVSDLRTNHEWLQICNSKVKGFVIQESFDFGQGWMNELIENDEISSLQEKLKTATIEKNKERENLNDPTKMVYRSAFIK